MLKKIMIVLSMLILSPGINQAQQITGNLDGKIFDQQMNPVSGVNIVLSGNSLQGQRGTISNDNGYFRLIALPTGQYDITISHIAYHDIRFKKVSIRLGKTTSLGEIQMVSRSIEMPEIDVMDEKPVIDQTSTEAGMNLSYEVFETLPTERNFHTIITLSPQASISYQGDDANIAGSTGQENIYYIDGMNVTDPYKAVGGTNLPYNFVKEIELKSGGYEAEYGRATGGIVNVITYSGSNEFQAKAFGFFTSHRFAGEKTRGFVDLGTGDFSRYDAGMSIGGPIMRDNLWFFLSYNRNTETEDIEFPGLGIKTDKKISNIFAGKLTWRMTDNSNLVFTVLGDPSKRDKIGHNAVTSVSPAELGNPDPFLGKREEGGVNISLKGNYIVNQNILVEGALSRLDIHQKAGPATELGEREPIFQDRTTGIWSGGYGNAFDHHSIRTAASLTGTYFIDDHSIKTGFQFENNLLDEDWKNRSETAPENAGAILKFAEDSYFSTSWDWQTKVRNQVHSLFIQGSFSVLPRVRLNAGLRWDGQYMKGLDSKLGHNITDQFQPRIGVIIQTGKSSSQKLSGSFGRFYEQIPNLITSYIFGPLEQYSYLYDHNPLDDPEGANPLPIAEPALVEKNLRGQHFYEFTLGYETQIKSQFKFGIRGVYRTIRDIIQNSNDIYGNPGRGELDFLPKPKREYTALEISLEKFKGRSKFFASYVLSRNYGNYTGLYDSDYGQDQPHNQLNFQHPDQFKDALGLLPNDRTHNLKLNGSYNFNYGLAIGATFVWQTGTPLSEFGSHTMPFLYTFLRKRGTVGRTPSIWDLSFRATYNLNNLFKTPFSQKLILDVFHLFSQRKPVRIEQLHFVAVDPETGEQINENPNYLKPLLYQLPMMVRLGIEIGFNKKK